MDASDMELLTLAARAAGYEVARVADDGRAVMLAGMQEPWNPRDDDADAFRLAMKARVSITPSTVFVLAQGLSKHRETYADHGGDEMAAARLAILRAAAVVGKALAGEKEGR